MNTLTDTPTPARTAPWGWVVVALAAWIAAYSALTPFADAVIATFGLSRQTDLGEALHFFFFDTPKVLLLLTGIVFAMGVIHTFVAPERARALLSGGDSA